MTLDPLYPLGDELRETTIHVAFQPGPFHLVASVSVAVWCVHMGSRRPKVHHGGPWTPLEDVLLQQRQRLLDETDCTCDYPVMLKRLISPSKLLATALP